MKVIISDGCRTRFDQIKILHGFAGVLLKTLSFRNTFAQIIPII